MKLPLVSGKHLFRALIRLGFGEVSRKGSHVEMKHTDGHLIVFPFHDEIDRFPLKGALRDAEIEVRDLLRALK